MKWRAIKKYHLVGLLTISLSVAGILAIMIWLPPHQEEITKFTQAHPLLAPLVIIVWRIIGIVVPPIPGGVVSYALIPIIGWFLSFLYATIGMLIGATIAFFVARKFREKLVKRIISLQKLHEWEGKLSGKTELLTFLGIRFTTGPIMDFISYVAGLTKISYGKFLLATTIALISDALSYYLGETVYKQFAQKRMYLGLIMVAVILLCSTIYYLKIKKETKEPESIE